MCYNVYTKIVSYNIRTDVLQCLHKDCCALLASYAHFLCANRSLVDFHIGHEKYIAYGIHILFENQPVIDCQIGNAQSMHHGVFFSKSLAKDNYLGIYDVFR